MLRVGIIGYGYWGPNLARNFNSNPDCKVTAIADRLEKRRSIAAAAYPDAKVVEDEAVMWSDAVDVVVVATPTFTHYELAKNALEHGKHVWIEKPMASTAQQAQELTEIAEANNLVLMVDHTFLFTGAVQTLKALVDTGDLGDLYYYDSVRINLGIFQHDVNVIWDLAPHDFSIMDFLLGPKARAVTAQGAGHYGTGLEDVAYVTVHYDDNLIAHFHLNWLSPVKLRRTIIGGSKKMVVWDDLNPEERLKIYDKGMEVTTQEGLYRVLATPRMGAMHSPVVPNTEALSSEVEYFVECVAEKKKPFNDGAAGVRVVSLLEATELSLKAGGKRIDLA